MTISVHNNDGTDTEWVMTTGSANTLQNLGFGKDGPNTVKPGDIVTISYFAARNGKPIGFIRSITLPDKPVDIATDADAQKVLFGQR